MIELKSTEDEIPEPGKRVLVRLTDGRFVSGIVTEGGGFEIEHVDSFDLVQSFLSQEPIKWTYI
jgi:primosomal protein N'